MRCPYPSPSSALSSSLAHSPSWSLCLFQPLSPRKLIIIIIVIVAASRLQTEFICSDHLSTINSPSQSPFADAHAFVWRAQIAIDSDEPHENNQPSFCILHGCNGMAASRQ